MASFVVFEDPIPVPRPRAARRLDFGIPKREQRRLAALRKAAKELDEEQARLLKKERKLNQAIRKFMTQIKSYSPQR